jgi:hypothetical protein
MPKRKVKKIFSRTKNKCSVKAVKDVFKKMYLFSIYSINSIYVFISRGESTPPGHDSGSDRQGWRRFRHSRRNEKLDQVHAGLNQLQLTNLKL